MIEDAGRWGDMLITHIAQCTIVALVAWALALSMSRAPARLVHKVWLISLVKWFLPLPLLGAFFSQVVPWTSMFGSQKQVVWPAVPIAGLRELTVSPIPVNSANWPWIWLGALWLCGTAALLAIQVRRHRSETTPVATEPVDTEKLDRILAECGIPRRAVKIEGGRGVPSVRGLVRQRIAVPAFLVTALSEEELKAILMHEKAHQKRKDPWTAALRRLAWLLFYAFPPLWLIQRRLTETAEIACDEAVLAAGVEPRTYARALARTLQLCLSSARSPAVDGGGTRSLLRLRFERIAHHETVHVARRHRVALAGVVGVALLLSVAPIDLLAERHDPDSDSSAGKPSLAFDRTTAPLVGGVDEVTQPIDLLAERHDSDSDSTAGEKPFAFDRTTEPLVAGVDGVTQPRFLKESKVKPVYPAAARDSRAEGRVILQAMIDIEGKVRDLEPLQQTGDPTLGFAEAAMDAVRQWRYVPAELDGKPVPVYFTIAITFSLT